MKITFTADGRTVKAKLPHENATFAVVNIACSSCKKKPMSVRGKANEIESRDTYRSDARCVDCGEDVGVLRVKVDTIFGIEEDAAVLSGRARVY